jgi:hypothetical protein
MTDSLEFIFDGWQAYQKSIVYAVKPLTPDQLVWRPAEICSNPPVDNLENIEP